MESPFTKVLHTVIIIFFLVHDISDGNIDETINQSTSIYLYGTFQTNKMPF